MKAIIPSKPAARSRVMRLQRILGIAETGEYDARTQAEIRAFQTEEKLVVDAEVGPRTWDALVVRAHELNIDEEVFGRLGLDRIDLPGTKSIQRDDAGELYTYTHVTFRADAATALRPVVDHVASLGGVLPTAGAMRELAALVSAGRVAASGHHIGRDVDWSKAAMMHDPLHDELVVERAPDLGPRRWRVFVRVEHGPDVMQLDAVVWGRSKSVRTLGRFVDLTGMLAARGFIGIRARRESWWEAGAKAPTVGYDGAEAWHFGYRDAGLEVGETTFGDELLRLYSLQQLRGTAPWEARHRTYRTPGGGKGWF